MPKRCHNRSIEAYKYVSDVKLIGIFEGYLDLLHAAVSRVIHVCCCVSDAVVQDC